MLFRIVSQEYKLDFSAVWEQLITADCVITGKANRNHLVNQQGIQMEKTIKVIRSHQFLLHTASSYLSLKDNPTQGHNLVQFNF